MKLTKTLILLFLLPLSLYAADSEMDLAKNAFNQGDYAGALEQFFKIELEDKDDMAELYYWRGVTQNKLQRFDGAVNSLNSAIDLGFDEDDIYYEYGQALYGSQELEKARENFKKSVEEDFNIISSTYYIAYISQLLEDFEQAEDNYKIVLEHKDRDITINQSATYQLANIELAKIENKTDITKDQKSEAVRMNIIPDMKSALLINQSSTQAAEINQKIEYLIKEYNITPKTLANGRVISDQPWKLKLSEKVNYDTNVVLEGEDFVRENQETNISSFVNNTEFFFNYRFVLNNNRITLTPEFKIDRIFHTERKNDAIFQNDAYNIIPALKGTHEHTIDGKMAASLVDLIYSYTARDYLRNGSVIFYAKSIGLSLGEKVKWFDFGESTLKLKYKSQTGYTSNIDATTFSLFANQNFNLQNKHIVVAVTSFDFKSVEKEIDSSNSYFFQGKYIIPTIGKGWVFTGGLGLTILDTKEQSTTRGTEIKINPGFGFNKKITTLLEFSFNYDFIKNSSDDTNNFAYSKHVVEVGLNFEM